MMVKVRMMDQKDGRKDHREDEERMDNNSTHTHHSIPDSLLIHCSACEPARLAPATTSWNEVVTQRNQDLYRE
jgi:hypothetical protein